MGEKDGERMWERGWDGHREAQLRRMARLPLRDRIRWLEQAQKLVSRLQKARRTAR